jgi:dTDP-4-dehydrorhamnose reductase
MANRKPKIFIVGISGFMGYHLALHLRKDFLVAGAYFNHKVDLPDIATYPVSYKNIELLDTLVRVQAPDILINAMGINDRKVVDESAKTADNINVVLAVSLAILAAKVKGQFIQLSCADVFDGKDGNYKEEDTDYTLDDSYGKQKVTTASYIRAQTLESNILRFGRAVGLGHPYRLSDFDRIRILVGRGDPIAASKKKIHSYISTRSFCEAVQAMITGPFPGKHRLFHIGGPALSEFQLVEGWAQLLGMPTKGIKSPHDDSARNLSLNCEAFAKAYPTWKPETQKELYLSVMADLNPGVGVRKWQKALQLDPPPPK